MFKALGKVPANWTPQCDNSWAQWCLGLPGPPFQFWRDQNLYGSALISTETAILVFRSVQLRNRTWNFMQEGQHSYL